MNRDFQIGLRLEEDDFRKLERLEAATVRTRSDMLRFLIRQEFTRLFQHDNYIESTQPAPTPQE